MPDITPTSTRRNGSFHGEPFTLPPQAEGDAGLADGLPRRSLHDDIYIALRHALMTGDLVPGQAVPIRALAEKFGTSVIPVRDALKRLVAERALEMLPNRTVCVSDMTRRRFQEILNVRLSIETMLARQAAELIQPDEVAHLEAVNAEMHDAVARNEVKRYLACNQQFHFDLYAAARSTVMMPIVESLWLQVGPFLNGVFTTSGTSSSNDNHQQVLKAIRRRDSAAVGIAIGHDIADAADLVLARNEFVSDRETAK